MRNLCAKSLLLFLLSSPFFCLYADENYRFIDQYGDEIIFTRPQTVYTASQSGLWGQEASRHIPKMSFHIRYEGVANIRIVTLLWDHAMHDKESGSLSKIYLLDKDDLVVAYHAFTPLEKKAVLRTQINGVINYVKVYTECSKHGTWMSEFHFPFRSDTDEL